jgi:hypothetical protein
MNIRGNAHAVGRSGNATAVTIPATRPWFSRPRTCFTRVPHLSETLGVVPTGCAEPLHLWELTGLPFVLHSSIHVLLPAVPSLILNLPPTLDSRILVLVFPKHTC